MSRPADRRAGAGGYSHDGPLTGGPMDVASDTLGSLHADFKQGEEDILLFEFQLS